MRYKLTFFKVKFLTVLWSRLILYKSLNRSSTVTGQKEEIDNAQRPMIDKDYFTGNTTCVLRMCYNRWKFVFALIFSARIMQKQIYVL